MARTRTSINVPAKGRMRDMADRLWSIAVRDDWGGVCAVCGIAPCDAHHLIPRQNYATRYDLRNGIALCRRHHKFCPHVSPHQTSAGFMMWLEANYLESAVWLIATVSDGHYKRETQRNAAYFCGVLLALKEHVTPEDFERVCGVKFSRYLTEEYE